MGYLNFLIMLFFTDTQSLSPIFTSIKYNRNTDYSSNSVERCVTLIERIPRYLHRGKSIVSFLPVPARRGRKQESKKMDSGYSLVANSGMTFRYLVAPMNGICNLLQGSSFDRLYHYSRYKQHAGNLSYTSCGALSSSVS